MEHVVPMCINMYSSVFEVVDILLLGYKPPIPSILIVRQYRMVRRKLRGGGPGAAYSVGPEVLVGDGSETTQLPYLVNQPISNCQATSPGYALSNTTIARIPGGLPGMSGGRRRYRKSRRGKSRRGRRTMRGGRYESANPIAPIMDTPNVGITPAAVRIACEAGQGSPLPSPTVPTEPPIGKLPPVPNVGLAESEGAGIPGYNANVPGAVMRGGALTPPYSGGTPLEMTTAGYSHFMSGQPGAVTQTQSGVPFMINEPAGGRLGIANACTTVPGGTANANLGNTMRGGRKRRMSKRRKARKSRGRK